MKTHSMRLTEVEGKREVAIKSGRAERSDFWCRSAIPGGIALQEGVRPDCQCILTTKPDGSPVMGCPSPAHGESMAARLWATATLDAAQRFPYTLPTLVGRSIK